ncbi:MAG: carbohydrate porin [Burkholderiales bacterium]
MSSPGARSRALLALGFLLLAARSLAQTPPAIGDAARQRLLAQGVRLEAGYTGEVVRNFSGGLKTGSAFLGGFDFQATVDGKRSLGLDGVTFYVHVLGTHGDDPSALAGDAQGISNIAAQRGLRLFEAWGEQNFVDRNMSLLAGRFDLNAEFYHLDSASLFLNSSFGIGPEMSQTGRGGPSIFPNSSYGARFEWRGPPVVLRAAVLNGVPVSVARADGSGGARRQGDGLLYVGEASIVLPLDASRDDRKRSRRMRLGRAALAVDRDSKAALGLWHYTGTFNELSSSVAGRRRDRSGAYLIAEQVLYRDALEPARRVRVFGQFGAGDERFWRFASYVGAGITMTAPFAGRSDDEFGFGIARARSGTAFLVSEQQAGSVFPGVETAIEVTYLYSVSGRISMQPTLQRILHPAGAPGLRDATVGMLRFELAL